MDECNDDICKNGATCINTDGSVECTCTAGWTGPTCETGKLLPNVKKILELRL